MSPDDLNSFRPVSNLTFLSKIIERIATKQLTLHADQNELFPARQSAYRRFHSTKSAVLVVHNIIRAIDEGHVVALALLDLSSAFDTVDRINQVNPSVEIFCHRATTSLVPFIPHWPYTSVHHSFRSYPSCRPMCSSY